MVQTHPGRAPRAPVRRAARAVRLPVRLGGAAGRAADRRADRGLHPGRRRPLGRVLLRDAPAGDAARARTTPRRVLIGCESFRDEVVERLRRRARPLHHRPGRGRHRAASSRARPCAGRRRRSGTAAVSRPGRRAERRAGHARRAGAAARPGRAASPRLISGIGPDLRRDRGRDRPPGSALRRRDHRLRRLRRGAGDLPPADIFVIARPMPRASATRSSRRWRAACRRLLPRGRRGGLHPRRRERPAGPSRATSPALAARSAACIEDGALRARLADGGAGGVPRTLFLAKRSAGRSWTSMPGSHGQAPDTGFDPVLPIDADCRFRATPHLL